MGKGFDARIAFDLDDPMGELVVRLVRRVHGLVPDRGPDPPRDRRGRPLGQGEPAALAGRRSTS